jgi:uncharacterized membrane protein
MSSIISPAAPAARASRGLLLASLALNLFFIGISGAYAVRHLSQGTPARPGEPARGAGARIERLAVALPADDGARLRQDYGSRREAIEAASAAYREAQERIRAATRAEPFDAAALRQVMADARSARQRLEEMLQDVIATAAGRMSPDGRRRLADYTPPSRGPEPQR